MLLGWQWCYFNKEAVEQEGEEEDHVSQQLT